MSLSTSYPACGMSQIGPEAEPSAEDIMSASYF